MANKKNKNLKSKKDQKKKKEVEFIKKNDDTIEVAIHSNPDKTRVGKFVAAGIIIGFVILPIVTLIFVLASKF